MRDLLLALTVAVMAAGCQATASLPTEDQIVANGARPIVGEELRALFLDKTHYGTTLTNGDTWYEYYAADGRLVIRVDGRPDPGIWRVEDEEVCFTYFWAGGDRTFCFRSYESDGLIYSVRAGDGRDGEVTALIDRIVEGNPEGLALTN